MARLRGLEATGQFIGNLHAAVNFISHDRSAGLDEIIAGLEELEDVQVGIIKSVDQQGTLTIETEAGTVYLQLSESEVLVNNGESPLKVTLSEEIDAGLIAAGSWLAIIPAAVVAIGLLSSTGWFAVRVFDNMLDDLFVDYEGDFVPWLAATTAGVVTSTYVATAMGLGTYHLVVLL